MEGYGPYLRGYIDWIPEVVDEPGRGIETVLTVQLIVAGDLEPSWSLFSDRAAAQNATRSLAWADRVRVAPTRIGGASETQLGWRRGSVLARLTGEEVNGGPAVLQAVRDARAAFGSTAQKQLTETLKTVDRSRQILVSPCTAARTPPSIPGRPPSRPAPSLFTTPEASPSGTSVPGPPVCSSPVCSARPPRRRASP